MYSDVSIIPKVLRYILMNPNVFKCIRHFQMYASFSNVCVIFKYVL